MRAARSPPTSISCRFELFVTSHGGHSSDQKEIQHGVTGRRRREVENMVLLASAARRAARTTAIQKAFRCICSQRTKKYDENGLNSFNSVEQISSERHSTVHITRCARGILKKAASPENKQFSWKE